MSITLKMNMNILIIATRKIFQRYEITGNTSSMKIINNPNIYINTEDKGRSNHAYTYKNSSDKTS